MKIVTSDEMRAIERRSENTGVSTAALMEHAGRSVAEEGRRCLGGPRGKPVLVLVGPGNNGGDGLVAARHLHDAGARVTIYVWNRDPARDGHYAAAQQRGVTIIAADDDPERSELRSALAKSVVVVDALLGTGRARPVVGVLKTVLDTVNEFGDATSTVLAVDLPTGMNADTGQVDESTLRADVTVALGYPKTGLFAFPGANYVGRLVIGDLGLPPGIADDIRLELATSDGIARLLPPRPADAHKGTFGKVLVAGGSANYLGAPVLVCLAAGRVGAGLVTLACARSLHPIFGAKLTESTFAPLPDVAGALASHSVGTLLDQLEGYNTLILGPGLGRASETIAFVHGVLDRIATGDEITCVLDADALNALAAKEHWSEALPKRMVLTPHSGEMARLLQVSASAVNEDRVGVARKAAALSKVVVVLKGAFTVVAHPDGRATINPSASAALATAGTGDVLAGAIGGFAAQGLEPYEAALVGVFVHGRAGQLLAQELGDTGALAGDLPPLLPKAIAAIKLGSTDRSLVHPDYV